MENAIDIYKSLARPPKDALREIQAGKLKGKTDINPQWRYKAMTEKFGLVGIGWRYEVQKLWTEQGAGDEVLAFAKVSVFVKDGENWSDPIEGIGGSKLVAIEKGNPVSNDEGYKMAVTDAFSTALKMLGVAADIYAGLWDGSKYRETPTELPPKVQTIKDTFDGEVVEPKQPTKPQEAAKLAFEPKGGETTPAEKEAIAKLLSSKDLTGKPLFSKDEMKAYSDMRKDKTAAELIDIIIEERQNRLRIVQPEEVGIPQQQGLDIF
ncbi:MULTISPECIES: hypothetical protein [unclassified Treponema]|uniref:hypothetical protein n=1 Tax=unclassified Treponema TaxID=2638727 RepID=UPI0020A2729F|nr:MULTISPECIES: hypothetical protein [unclassified Treponema]UTC65989.1 hypothetical protein E4O06_08120 [Treponema sp. OMZ 789]UTC68719.1 hypothetical protein E4O01_08260 [Treponema sp. OMZ 790]UTC71449.1 hypothetical protein E4O02_08455 [Treponema sp. OMZ 791]